MVKLEKSLKLEYFVLKLDKVIDGRRLVKIIQENIDSDRGLCTARFLAEVILNCEVSEN